jgi:hypothetical protein
MTHLREKISQQLKPKSANRKTLWRQGCGIYSFPHQSPFSTAGLPAALEAAASGGDRERGPARAYIIINSLQTEM